MMLNPSCPPKRVFLRIFSDRPVIKSVSGAHLPAVEDAELALHGIKTGDAGLWWRPRGVAVILDEGDDCVIRQSRMALLKFEISPVFVLKRSSPGVGRADPDDPVRVRQNGGRAQTGRLLCFLKDALESVTSFGELLKE